MIGCARLLAEHPAPSGASFEAGLQWQRTLHAGGWVAPQWPVEYGGQGCTITADVIFLEETRRHRTQISGRVGVNMVGPTILAHGSPAQRAAHLARILSGEDIWCEMFSEPDAGSDLASVSTGARADGDHWVVTGQKVWSRFPAEANLGVLVARTDDASRGRGALSYLICEMDRPGVDVRPLRQMTGDSECAEISFRPGPHPSRRRDRPAGRRLVSPAHGAGQRTRPGLPLERQVILDRALHEVQSEVRSGARVLDANQRSRLVGDVIRARIFRLLSLRTLSLVASGQDLGPFSSLTKLFWSNFAQQLHQTHFALAGQSATAGDCQAWTQMLWYRQASIAGGTTAIQRNVVAERALGLPREVHMTSS